MIFFVLIFAKLHIFLSLYLNRLFEQKVELFWVLVMWWCWGRKKEERSAIKCKSFSNRQKAASLILSAIKKGRREKGISWAAKIAIYTQLSIVVQCFLLYIIIVNSTVEWQASVMFLLTSFETYFKVLNLLVLA